MQSPQDFVRAALECSIYISPKSHGLTPDEIIEGAGRYGFQPGETSDVLYGCGKRSGERLIFNDEPQTITYLYWPFYPREPEYRNIRAFDAVATQLRELAKAVGRRKARIQRDVIVAKAVQAGIPEVDVEAAITLWLIVGTLDQEGDVIFGAGNDGPCPPSEGLEDDRGRQLEDDRGRQAERRPGMAKVYDIVKDLIARRSDGRPKSAEPVKAFEQALKGIGFERFQMWWAQTSAELRCADASSSPMMSCVLSAALAEGALVMIVKRAQELGLMQSPDFKRPSTSWKFEDLINSAASGHILDSKVRERALHLNAMRNRIHVGRLMAERPTGPIPDLRPEEARDAKATLDMVLRCVVDWLHAHPVSAAQT